MYSTENLLTLTNSSTTSQPSIEGSTIWIEYLIILLWIMFIASLVVAKLKDRKHRQEVCRDCVGGLNGALLILHACHIQKTELN